MMYVQIKVTDQIERRVCPALSCAQESFERDSCTRYLKYARKFRPHDSRVVPCAWACPYDITTSNKDEKNAEIWFEILLCYFQEKMKKGFNIPFKPYFVVLDKSAKNGWNLKVILNFVVPVGTLSQRSLQKRTWYRDVTKVTYSCHAKQQCDLSLSRCQWFVL